MDDGNTHSGIRARYTILDGDRGPFQAWLSKTCAILDNEDCLEVFEGTELEPEEVLPKRDAQINLTNYDGFDYGGPEIVPEEMQARGHAHYVAREQQHRAWS